MVFQILASLQAQGHQGPSILTSHPLSPFFFHFLFIYFLFSQYDNNSDVRVRTRRIYTQQKMVLAYHTLCSSAGISPLFFVYFSFIFWGVRVRYIRELCITVEGFTASPINVAPLIVTPGILCAPAAALIIMSGAQARNPRANGVK